TPQHRTKERIQTKDDCLTAAHSTMPRYRVNCSTMMFLVILQGAGVVLFFIHVLLLSSWRSGSSFLGQVFSQHPSVFYLMEPVGMCGPNWISYGACSSSTPMCRLCLCGVTVELCARHQSVLLRHRNVVLRDCRGRAGLELRSPHHPPVSQGFMSDNAIVLEQKRIKEAEVQYQVMQEICRSHVRINERAVLKPPPFLKGRYKLVRYEDMARNPLEEINAMYQFVGLEMTTELATWIYKVTHGKGKGSIKEAFKITSRSATNVSQAWRTMLPYNKVRRIQEVCKGAMSLLGYRTVNSEKEQKRLDIDLLVPREPYQFSWLPDKTQHPNNN
uniref:Sulfotransferase n=1 Tax=Maylandia zebra TaxID=106582 RepID=A0A3P9DUV5_9CICH